MTEQRGKIVEITNPDQDRYATVRLIDWWEQARLDKARVLVAGAGALGNEVVKNLALLGVGQIWLVDFDHVETSNLSRAVLLREADVGLPKAEAVARRALELNPAVRVTPLLADLTTELGLGVVRRMDVVIGCLDSREARRALNQACWRAGRPWVDGGLNVLDGLVRVFRPPAGPCYECTWSARDYELANVRYACPPGQALPAGRAPTTVTAAALIAAMQAQEAVKLLHELPVIEGRGGYYSGQTTRLLTMRYAVRPDCPAHEAYSPVLELPLRAAATTVNEFLAAAGGESLALEQPVVTQSYCQYCQQGEALFRPYPLPVALAVCPRCRRERAIDVSPALAVSEATAAVRLSQLGIPPLAVLPVRRANGWVYGELSGDAPALALPVMESRKMT